MSAAAADDGASADGMLPSPGKSAPPSLQRPRVLLMGPSKSGKSSIIQVLFGKRLPHEMHFVEPTASLAIEVVASNPYVQFEVWDIPADADLDAGVPFDDQLLPPDLVFGGSVAVVYVMDAQDSSPDAAEKLRDIVSAARAVNPELSFEVFIHKVDGDLAFKEGRKVEVQREMQERVEIELEDMMADAQTELTITFFLTSIFDHSIYEAFSKVVHKLIPQLPQLENLLRILIDSCEMEKAFLFDAVTKLYLATDHRPVDMTHYELCSDMIDVVIDVSCIYGGAGRAPRDADHDSAGALADAQARSQPALSDDAAHDAAPGPDAAADAAAMAAGEHAAADAAADAGGADATGGAAHGDGLEGLDGLDGLDGLVDEDGRREDLAFDSGTGAVIRLNNNMVLYLKRVASYLALACVFRGQNYDKQGLVDHNVAAFKEALDALFAAQIPHA